jgi:hypothetical protein
MHHRLCPSSPDSGYTYCSHEFKFSERRQETAVNFCWFPADGNFSGHCRGSQKSRRISLEIKTLRSSETWANFALQYTASHFYYSTQRHISITAHSVTFVLQHSVTFVLQHTASHLYYSTLRHICITAHSVTFVLQHTASHLYYSTRRHICITAHGVTFVLQHAASHLYYSTQRHIYITAHCVTFQKTNYDILFCTKYCGNTDKAVCMLVMQNYT